MLFTKKSNINSKRQITVMGSIWDFWPILKVVDDTFKDSLFVSFYKPILNGEIDRNKIVEFNESKKQIILLPIKVIKRTYKIYKLVRKFNPDYIISHHDDANISIILFLLISKLLGKNIRFVAYIHNGDVYQQDSFFLRKVIPFTIKKFYKYFDKVITVSEGNGEFLMNKFNLKNVEVIPNPIDLKKIIQLSEKGEFQRNETKIFESNEMLFLHIGRFTEGKNLFNLINVFSLIRHFPWKLVLIGEGELREKILAKIRDYNLTEKIQVIGFQKNVFKFIKKSDCLILNSYWESFGQVLVEALALNKIVVSTDCNFGPREILCPKLKADKKIKYPYFCKYGILTKPYDLNRDNHESNNILKKLLIDIILNKEKYKKRYLNTIVRAKDFDTSKIKEKIKQIL